MWMRTDSRRAANGRPPPWALPVVRTKITPLGWRRTPAVSGKTRRDARARWVSGIGTAFGPGIPGGEGSGVAPPSEGMLATSSARIDATASALGGTVQPSPGRLSPAEAGGAPGSTARQVPDCCEPVIGSAREKLISPASSSSNAAATAPRASASSDDSALVFARAPFSAFASFSPTRRAICACPARSKAFTAFGSSARRSYASPR